jgi:protein-disulfide isomerase
MTAHQQGTLTPAVHEKDHSLGTVAAPVTLVEYGDFQCPYCAQAHPIVKALQQRLGAKLRFVFRNFPLSEMHPEAFHAAEAAESVGAQTGTAAYWKMHDTLFEHAQESEWALDDEHLVRYAESCGADGSQVKRDLDEDSFKSRVRADFTSGVHSGVNGTPTFFINGVRFAGNWTDLRGFTAALEVAANRGSAVHA